MPRATAATSSSGPARSTNTPIQSTLDAFRTSRSTRTRRKSHPKTSETPISSAQASLASLSRWLETGSALRSREAVTLLRSLGLRSRHDLAVCYLKTSSDSSGTTRAARSAPSSGRWMRSGMMLSGRCSMANIGYRRAGPVSSLSDILEKNPDPKYFLSQTAVDSLMRHQAEQKKKGNNFKTRICRL